MTLPNGENIILKYCCICHLFVKNDMHSPTYCREMIRKRASLNKMELLKIFDPQSFTKNIKFSEQIDSTSVFDTTKSINDFKSKLNYLHNLKIFFKTKSALTIAIEGNIGAGKTTQLKDLNEIAKTEICTFREPLELWTNLNGINLLEKTYSDPKEWATLFQSFAMQWQKIIYLKHLHQLKFLNDLYLALAIVLLKLTEIGVILMMLPL